MNFIDGLDLEAFHSFLTSFLPSLLPCFLASLLAFFLPSFFFQQIFVEPFSVPLMVLGDGGTTVDRQDSCPPQSLWGDPGNKQISRISKSK